MMKTGRRRRRTSSDYLVDLVFDELNICSSFISYSTKFAMFSKNKKSSNLVHIEVERE